VGLVLVKKLQNTGKANESRKDLKGEKKERIGGGKATKTKPIYAGKIEEGRSILG